MTIVGLWIPDSVYNVIVGAPKGFNLKAQISKATRIKMAVAFMNYKGLEDILNNIDPSKVEMEVLVGLGFLTTDPRALEKLKSLKKSFRNYDFMVVIHKKSGMFHPKLLVVETPELHFALVGSANCTSGGHRSNCECTMYVDTPQPLADIENWFNSLMKSELAAFIAEPLTKKLIAEYKSEKGKADRSRREYERMVAQAQKELVKQTEAEIREWNKLVETAKKFRLEAEYSKRRKVCEDAVAKIRKTLHYPSFEGITETDWNSFFKIYELGRLRNPKSRDELFKEIDRFSETFRNLIDDSTPLVNRINSALSVKGLGPNTVTKILTVHNPDEYPTWNKVVAKSLSDFGIELPRTSEFGPKYLAFQKIMVKLLRETELEDMLALDAFLYCYYERNIKPNKKKKGK